MIVPVMGHMIVIVIIINLHRHRIIVVVVIDHCLFLMMVIVRRWCIMMMMMMIRIGLMLRIDHRHWWRIGPHIRSSSSRIGSISSHGHSGGTTTTSWTRWSHHGSRDISIHSGTGTRLLLLLLLLMTILIELNKFGGELRHGVGHTTGCTTTTTSRISIGISRSTSRGSC